MCSLWIGIFAILLVRRVDGLRCAKSFFDGLEDGMYIETCGEGELCGIKTRLSAHRPNVGYFQGCLTPELPQLEKYNANTQKSYHCYYETDSGERYSNHTEYDLRQMTAVCICGLDMCNSLYRKVSIFVRIAKRLAESFHEICPIFLFDNGQVDEAAQNIKINFKPCDTQLHYKCEIHGPMEEGTMVFSFLYTGFEVIRSGRECEECDKSPKRIWFHREPKSAVDKEESKQAILKEFIWLFFDDDVKQFPEVFLRDTSVEKKEEKDITAIQATEYIKKNPTFQAILVVFTVAIIGTYYTFRPADLLDPNDKYWQKKRNPISDTSTRTARRYKKVSRSSGKSSGGRNSIMEGLKKAVQQRSPKVSHLTTQFAADDNNVAVLEDQELVTPHSEMFDAKQTTKTLGSTQQGSIRTTRSTTSHKTYAKTLELPTQDANEVDVVVMDENDAWAEPRPVLLGTAEPVGNESPSQVDRNPTTHDDDDPDLDEENASGKSKSKRTKSEKSDPNNEDVI